MPPVNIQKILQQRQKQALAWARKVRAAQQKAARKTVQARKKAFQAWIRARQKAANPQPKAPPGRPRGGAELVIPPAQGGPVGGPMGKAPAARTRPPNDTTCDIYHGASAPPADPDVAAVPCSVMPDFRGGSEASEGDQDLRWTHVMTCDATVDVRDNYPDAPTHTVYIPDKSKTGYEVVFVEIVNRNQPGSFKRVYLDRKQPPSWPTNEL